MGRKKSFRKNKKGGWAVPKGSNDVWNDLKKGILEWKGMTELQNKMLIADAFWHHLMPPLTNKGDPHHRKYIRILIESVDEMLMTPAKAEDSEELKMNFNEINAQLSKEGSPQINDIYTFKILCSIFKKNYGDKVTGGRSDRTKPDGEPVETTEDILENWEENRLQGIHQLMDLEMKLKDEKKKKGGGKRKRRRTKKRSKNKRRRVYTRRR